MVDTVTTNTDKLDTAFGDQMRGTVEHFLKDSSINGKGVREVSKAVYEEELGKLGVTPAEAKKVHHAVDFLTTAASRAATEDLVDKLKGASADDLKNDKYRRDLDATVRIPTGSGSTEVTVFAETLDKAARRSEEEGGKPDKVSYGRIRTTINQKGRIFKELHEEVSNRIKSELNVNSDD